MLIRELGATPIDYQREHFTRVLPGGFAVVCDGIGAEGYRRSFAALKPDGLLCTYGSAGVLLCPDCREPMKLVRTIPHLAGLPEIQGFYCSRCKQAETRCRSRRRKWRCPPGPCVVLTMLLSYKAAKAAGIHRAVLVGLTRWILGWARPEGDQ